ncbi:MAG TPA: hypothetical protein VFX70_20210, partial [Mycobacteriales bacterium]|nr:hypothetical protein [Mycobacteriales bacterium]
SPDRCHTGPDRDGVTRSACAVFLAAPPPHRPATLARPTHPDQPRRRVPPRTWTGEGVRQVEDGRR